MTLYEAIFDVRANCNDYNATLYCAEEYETAEDLIHSHKWEWDFGRVSYTNYRSYETYGGCGNYDCDEGGNCCDCPYREDCDAFSDGVTYEVERLKRRIAEDFDC